VQFFQFGQGIQQVEHSLACRKRLVVAISFDIAERKAADVVEVGVEPQNKHPWIGVVPSWQAFGGQLIVLEILLDSVNYDESP
jgi:hypothetical protein